MFNPHPRLCYNMDVWHRSATCERILMSNKAKIRDEAIKLNPIHDTMFAMMARDSDDDRFPITSEIKKHFKLTKEGSQEMTDELEKIMVEERNEGRAEGRTEGRAEGRTEGRIETLIKLVTDGLLTIAQAAAQLGESEQDFSKRMPA